MNNKRLENFTESTIYLILVKALSFLPLLMLPLLARSEESFVFSQVMLVITIERFLFIVYEFGSHLPNINTISNILKNNGMNRSLNEISLIFSKVKFLRLLIWCFVALLIFLSLNFFEFASINRNFLWICLLSGLFRVLSPIWLFQAIRQLRYQFIMAIFSKMICFLVITYLFYLD